MATSEKILKLDVSNEQDFIYLKCKQYDHNSRIYRLIITDQHVPKLLNGDELVTVHITRSNGSYIDDICQWKDGKLYLTMTDEMLAVAGDACMEVKIFNSNGEILTTMTNHIKIEKSMLPSDRIVASDEFNVLNYLIQSALNFTGGEVQSGTTYIDFSGEIITENPSSGTIGANLPDNIVCYGTDNENSDITS